VLAGGLAAMLVAACGVVQDNTLDVIRPKQSVPRGQTLAWNASAKPNGSFGAELLLDNDSAFERKLELVRSAKKSLDLAYYIFSDDYSSSLFSEELLAAAHRGVQVRLLVDYHSAYPALDYFRMLERYGNDGAGSLRIRFYNRPTDIILKDAAYMTLSCADVGRPNDFADCDVAKYSAVQQAFAAYLHENPRPTPQTPTNFIMGGSESLVSALYAKDFKLAAKIIFSAKEESKNFTKPPAEPPAPQNKAKHIQQAVDAARLFWQARYSGDTGLSKLHAKLKLGFIFAAFGHKIDGLYDALTAYLPIDRPEGAAEALRDWEFWTEFLHHKFLFADGRRLVIGGRNIEDAYHLKENPFADRYVFMDTDLAVNFEQDQPVLTKTFDSLWNFSTMTARLDEVEHHADNDFLMAIRGESPDSAVRLEKRHAELGEKSKTFRARYSASPKKRTILPVDQGAELSYLENLPFSRDLPNERVYGSKGGLEGEYGKHIHAVWLQALEDACKAPEGSRDVIFHSAYFFLPSNLLAKLGQMIDGTLDCHGVKIRVLTNSPGTTDLNVINIVAHQSMSAFGEYYRSHRDPARGAELLYYEYRKQGEKTHSSVSLHSKVEIFGPDLFVGSANADARSYLMDTNNGFYIRRAPELRRKYLEWIDGILADSELIEDRTAVVLNSEHAELLAADKALLQKRLTEMLSEQGQPPPVAVEPIVDLIGEYLQRIYELSGTILRYPVRSDARERFDSLFKLL